MKGFYNLEKVSKSTNFENFSIELMMITIIKLRDLNLNFVC